MEKLVAFLGVLMMLCIVALIMAWPVMLLWNWLMPVIFGVTKITFIQALGVNLLCGFLFRSTNKNNS